MGQKYGYRPFPPTIDADEFSAIRAELAAESDDDDDDDVDAGGDRQASLALLDTWFKRNTNVIPPVYALQPISSVLPDYALDSVSSIPHGSFQTSDRYQTRSHSSTLFMLYPGLLSGER